jgi:hypothetical protein
LVSPPYEEWGHGLICADDWCPEPAFFAYQMLTQQLAGYE